VVRNTEDKKSIDAESSRRGRMVVGFATTYAISAYHYEYVEPESRSWRGLLDTTCDIIMTERR
jgi:hypothetical protein